MNFEKTEGLMEHCELEQRRSDAAGQDKCYSKARLRDEFRMKPRPDAVPVKHYKNEFGKQFGIYRISDCIPIQERQAAPSKKQLQARAILAVKAKLRSKLAKASAIACQWLDDDPLVLDTETTGLGYDAQVIEIAIADASGKVLFDTRIKPTVAIEAAAQEVHGISPDALINAPSWPEVANRIEALLSGRTVIIFNASFDSRLIAQTAGAFGLETGWWSTCTTRCAMHLAASAYGSTNPYGSISLADATSAADVPWTGAAHSAAADTLATVELVKSIARVKPELDLKLSKLLEEKAG